jgi:MoaD family protein
MSVKVLVPTVLQKYTENQSVLECDGNNVQELVETLEQNYPGFKGRLRDDEGKLRRFLNFYVNSEDIRFLENEQTSLQDGDEVSIVPAVAGGAASRQ